MPLQLSHISDAEQLASLREEWTALVDGNPFLSWDWADCWWRHYRSSAVQLLVLAVRDDAGQLVGLAPWVLEQSLSRGRVVRFIGSNEVCGDRLTILATAKHRPAVLQRIVQAMIAEFEHLWDVIELIGVEQANADIAELVTLAQHAGNQVHVRPDLNCWKVSLPTTWDDYLKMLSKPRRSRTRKLLRNSIDAGRAEQRTASNGGEFEQAFSTLVDLHQKRRNSIGEPGCFASDRYYNFHYEFASRMFEQHKLRLAVLYYDGQPAAVEYEFLGDGTIYHYQCGFEPALADVNPGSISLASTLRWAIGAGYHTFDLLRGDEPYKASLGAEPAPLVQSRIVGSQGSAKLRHLIWRTQASIKRWARDSRALAGDRHGDTSKHCHRDLAELDTPLTAR